MFSVKENFKKSLKQPVKTSEQPSKQHLASYEPKKDRSSSPFNLKQLIYKDRAPEDLKTPEASKFLKERNSLSDSVRTEDLLSCFRDQRLQAKENLNNSHANNLYTILQCEVDASEEEIKRTYKKLCLKYHPDKPTGDQATFIKITRAYKILMDPELRATFDEFGWDAVQFSTLLREETINL